MKWPQKDIAESISKWQCKAMHKITVKQREGHFQVCKLLLCPIY